MVKNTGKKSEAAFENTLVSRFGKRVFINRLQDAQALHGLNGHAVKVGRQPADYVVTFDGVTIYAEVKSSVNATTFSFSCISTHQLAAARQVRLAGGKYLFFIHNIKNDIFYIVDSAAIDRVSKTRSSMKWSEMEPWTEYESYKRS